MNFSALRTLSFRNLADGEVDTQARNVFLVGENGQGKTNFLEALYFCSYASSFRGAPDAELPKKGGKTCSAGAQFGDSLYDKIAVTCEKGKKSVHLDGKPLEDRRDLLRVAPCIVFCHEDMEFAGGSPERRRWFFDQNLSLQDPAYLEDLRKYRQVLKSRNALLKKNGDPALSSLLDALDPQLARYGLPLMAKRRETAEHFSRTFGSLYEEVAGLSGLGIRYAESWKPAGSIEEIVRALRDRRESDLAGGLTFTGPHRDRYIFTRDGGEFCRTASTGQRRLIALLLRAAQAQRFSEIAGRGPILLLDDVLLELDPEKRRRFLSVLPDYDQAFFTFLPEEPFERYRKPDTLVYYVQAGLVRKP
ncbi:MAG: DNA replication and repair protein RecF [Spirochaetaceae bacterium]|jgi:DNA replication and repair protein RecF|nr:DNA replication and repair protein RecF [Spirochaetaceae bacterium]